MAMKVKVGEGNALAPASVPEKGVAPNEQPTLEMYLGETPDVETTDGPVVVDGKHQSAAYRLPSGNLRVDH